jgi:protein phosphatase
MDLTGKIEIVGQSHTGLKRSHNEDCIGTDLTAGLVALADGMGGYKAGEVASALAINTLVVDITDRLATIEHKDNDVQEFTPESILAREIVEKSNDIIYQTALAQPQYKGMGTTLVMALFYDNRVTVAHVGDSRMYRFRSGTLEQITVDHTLMQELIERGFYTREEARNSMNKNLVTRALGIDPEVQVDIQEDLVLKNDIFLLCSDGLNDMVEDEEIRLTIKENADNLEEAAKKLIQQANDNGGNDNVSVILVKSLESFPAKQSWIRKFVDWF